MLTVKTANPEGFDENGQFHGLTCAICSPTMNHFVMMWSWFDRSSEYMSLGSVTIKCTFCTHGLLYAPVIQKIV